MWDYVRDLSGHVKILQKQQCKYCYQFNMFNNNKALFSYWIHCHYSVLRSLAKPLKTIIFCVFNLTLELLGWIRQTLSVSEGLSLMSFLGHQGPYKLYDLVSYCKKKTSHRIIKEVFKNLVTYLKKYVSFCIFYLDQWLIIVNKIKNKYIFPGGHCPQNLYASIHVSAYCHQSLGHLWYTQTWKQPGSTVNSLI